MGTGQQQMAERGGSGNSEWHERTGGQNGRAGQELVYVVGQRLGLSSGKEEEDS